MPMDTPTEKFKGSGRNTEADNKPSVATLSVAPSPLDEHALVIQETVINSNDLKDNNL